MSSTPAETPRGPTGWVSFLLDFGPLLAFFAAFKLGQVDGEPFRGILVGTVTFLVAITTWAPPNPPTKLPSCDNCNESFMKTRQRIHKKRNLSLLSRN